MALPFNIGHLCVLDVSAFPLCYGLFVPPDSRAKRAYIAATTPICCHSRAHWSAMR